MESKSAHLFTSDNLAADGEDFNEDEDGAGLAMDFGDW